MIGKVIKGKYSIMREIGLGTVSTAYLAMNLTTNEVVALKIIHTELAKEGQFLRRFRREAKLLKKLDSPYAVRLLDYGEEGGLNFIALEYVPGRTLDQALKNKEPLEVERALSIARQVAQCLADASTVGIVHRDLRPANVIVTLGDAVKVTDFGVAAGADLSRLSSTGTVGTPHYLAPELAEGKTADVRADIYSLGVILFEMMTGQVPYQGEDAASIVLKHQQDLIPSARHLNSEISQDVDLLIAKCLAKEPQERYLPLQLVRAIADLVGEGEVTPEVEVTLAGQTLGQYQLLEQIGRGGMATVYKAHQPSLDRYVAVKVLPVYLAHEPDFAARFEREARAIAKLDHPNILAVYDSGREGDLSYIVMKYVEAGTLKERLGKPLDLKTVLEIISQVGEALDYAHRQGVIHRDVKPSNVLMDAEGWALLADFGLAKMAESSVLTETGSGVGTPAYMSPEQGQGTNMDARSDVYSLGVMLYEMLTGRVPYKDKNPMAVVFKHIAAPLPRPTEFNPDIPEPVERVVLKALSKNPAKRYKSVRQMVEALRKAAVVEAVPFWQKVPLWGWGAIGGLILLAAVGGALLVGLGKPRPALVAERATTPTATVLPTAIPTSVPSTPTPLPPTDTPTRTPLPPTDTLTPIPPTPTPLPPTDTPTPVPPTPTPLPPTDTPTLVPPTNTPSPTDTPTPTPTPHLTGKIAHVMSDGIYVMDADGNNRKRAYKGDVRISALSPDGNKIAFTTQDGLWVMDVNGNGVQQIISSGRIYHTAWAPDSNQIVYTDSEAGYIVKLSDRFPQPVGVNMSHPDWSPDSVWFAYQSAQGLVKQPVSGGATFVLDSSTNWEEGLPAWSPDGTKIAYSKQGDIFVINADGSGQKKLTDHPANDWDPSWSPDGSQITFTTDRDGNKEIYAINPDGSNPINLTNSAKDEEQPTWAP